jgi:tetratricopeptide (TPR) repeat protein
VQADKTSELRQRLPQLKGQELIDAYFELYLSSLSSNDIVYQQRCINDLIAEAHHQGDREKEGMARSMKIKLFYNNDLNDSIYEQTPNTLRFLETANIWDTYYEIWLILIETYNFDGKTIMGMDEAKKMITDAELHNNQYGIGLGHFALGLVYAMMRNHEEAANAYQKSVSILTGFTPEPTQLAEIFGYYSEVLDILKRYNAMNTLNNQWRDFLKEQYNNTDADASMAGEELDEFWRYAVRNGSGYIKNPLEIQRALYCSSSHLVH